MTNRMPRTEYGITSTVRTCISRTTLLNVINTVTSRKINAVLQWICGNGHLPENSLIIGSYLTGSGIANRLVAESPVTVLDIHPHLRCLLSPGVSFVTDIDEITDTDWDFVMDTTGIGGTRPADIERIKCSGAFLAEDPVSDGSDEMIRQACRCHDIVGHTNAKRCGILRSGGLGSKTSGTMTLSVDVLRNSMDAAVRERGVLYSTAPMEFSERILFKEKDPCRYFRSLERPALVVSALDDIDCDSILMTNLSRIVSHVTNFRRGDSYEGSTVFQKYRGKNPLGSVVGGRSGWFYRPR